MSISEEDGYASSLRITGYRIAGIASLEASSSVACNSCRRMTSRSCVMALCKRLNLFPGVKPNILNWAIRRVGPGFGCTSPARSRREERSIPPMTRMRLHHGGKLADFLISWVLCRCFLLRSCWPLNPENHGSGGWLKLLFPPDAPRAGPRSIGRLLASPKTGY